jgi:hypothetical protein
MRRAPALALLGVLALLGMLALLLLVGINALRPFSGAAKTPQATAQPATPQPSATSLAAGPLATATLRRSDFTVEYAIAASQPWQDTGILLVAGDLVEITYLEGSWTENSRDTPLSGPEGILPALAAACDQPLPSETAGYNVLAGKVGQAQPFKVGGLFKDTVQSAGKLYLRLNDCDDKLDDNEGTIKVKIIIRR